MKKTVLLLLLCFPIFAFSQTQQAVPELIEPRAIFKEAMKLFEDGKFEEAANAYRKITENDSFYDNAQVELANCLTSARKFMDVIDFSKKKVEANSKFLVNYYMLWANALDDTGRSEEALVVYNEAIAKYPENHSLYFDKGIALQKLKRYAEAEKSYIQSIKINPYYASSHIRLGSLYYTTDRPSQAIMALEFALLLEPESNRSFNLVKAIQDIAQGEKSDDVVKLANAGEEDDFSELDAILKSKVALSERYKSKLKLNYDLVKQTQVLFEKMHFAPKDKGFCNNFYVPFFQELWAKDYFEPFIAEIMTSVKSDNMSSFEARNRSKIKGFITWARNYIDENLALAQGTAWNPGAKIYRIFNNGTLSSTGVMKNNNFVGKTTYYYSSGNIKAVGDYDNNGKKTGEWKYYDENAVISEISNFKNGQTDGPFIVYYSNGNIEKKGTDKMGLREGPEQNYFFNGKLHSESNYKNGKYDGKITYYYANGQKRAEGFYKNGLLEGTVSDYFANGKLKDNISYVNDKNNGPAKYYYANGKLHKEGSFKDGAEDGFWTTYYSNGTKHTYGAMKNGKRVGKWMEYYSNGVASDEMEYSSGTLDGIYKEFDLNGKQIYETTYNNGKISKIKSYNAQGGIISDEKTSGKKYSINSYWISGNKRVEGMLIKSDRDGEWKYYAYCGALIKTANYKNDLENGEVKEYYISGQLHSEVNYTDGSQNGLFKKYYKNGKIESTGHMVNGKAQGFWYFYRPDGSLENERYFVEGSSKGKEKKYDLFGKLASIQYYNNEGVFVQETFFDSSGKITQDIKLKDGTGDFELLFPNKKPSLKVHYNNGKKEGTLTSFDINGNVNRSTNYINNEADGESKFYYWNHVKQTEETFIDGDIDGNKNTYYDNGQMKELEVFNLGTKEGIQKSFAENGNVTREAQHIANMTHGYVKIFDDENNLTYERDYYHDNLIAIKYNDKSGKPSTAEVKNETINITGYYPSGATAFELNVVKGEFSGAYKRYFSNGKVFLWEQYLNDELHGDRIQYYRSGAIKSKSHYSYGMYDGKVIEYYENGKVKSEFIYIMDVPQGPAKYYDSTGKLIREVIYYNGFQISEKSL